MLMYHCDSVLLVNAVESSLFSSGCCKSLKLSATGAAAEKYPFYLGSYEATGEEHKGAPVYRNSEDRYLYIYRDGTWRASYKIGYSGGYKSVDTTAQCPTSISQWQDWDDGDWRSGDITAQCSVHT